MKQLSFWTLISWVYEFLINLGKYLESVGMSSSEFLVLSEKEHNRLNHGNKFVQMQDFSPFAV